MGRFIQILVVDDDRQLRRTLRAALLSQGYEVRVAEDGQSALEEMKNWTPNVVITDLVMPNMDGIDLCRYLRTRSQVPIIVLSVRGEEHAKLQAFEAGADDYLTKPFSISELMARLNVALRRVVVPSESVQLIKEGDFRIDMWARRVWCQGVEVRLTPKEFDLLIYLAKLPHRVIARQALLSAVWGPDQVEQSEYLRVLVGQLRKKIEPEVSSPRYLLTEKSIGYRFEPGTES